MGFWDSDNRRRVRVHERTVVVQAGSADAQSAKMETRELADRVDKLTMVCHAMWTLIQEKTSLTEEDLFTRVADLDLRDGNLDGKMTKAIYTCTQCGRNVAARHAACLYCGTPKAAESAFDPL
ncbi:MAG: hypothetical protein GX591_19270 [Planctomycetes bacterium]|nr:hypothetical protein [Planctomycetota bacterium]